jgi:hypothetical protein
VHIDLVCNDITGDLVLALTGKVLMASDVAPDGSGPVRIEDAGLLIR